MSLVYVARKPCGHIVAVFPQNMAVKNRAEVMKQFTLANYDLEVADDQEVREKFATVCNCNRPPLLDLMEKAKDAEADEPSEDEGVDADSVEALAEEAQAEGVEEAIEEVVEEATQEAAQEAQAELDF